VLLTCVKKVSLVAQQLKGKAAVAKKETKPERLVLETHACSALRHTVQMDYSTADVLQTRVYLVYKVSVSIAILLIREYDKQTAGRSVRFR